MKLTSQSIHLHTKPSGESCLDAENRNASKLNVSEWTATVRE